MQGTRRSTSTAGIDKRRRAARVGGSIHAADVRASPASAEVRTATSTRRTAPDRVQAGAPRQQLEAIIDALHGEYREGDLGNLRDPIAELVYISLTRQTHAQNARRSWRAIEAVGGPEKLIDMTEDELELLLRPAGFSRQKARWIRQALELVRKRMGALSLEAARSWSNGELEKFLSSLPGISLKSAKCIMLYSMDRDVLPVDTHVRRVATRIGLVQQGLSERAIHQQLEDAVSPRHRYSLHVNAIWHGRKTCRALRPLCGQCIIRAQCAFGCSAREVARRPT